MHGRFIKIKKKEIKELHVSIPLHLQISSTLHHRK